MDGRIAEVGAIDQLVSGGDVLLGRARELIDLRARFAQALEGRGGLVLVSGDAGIGKTRLAEEFTNLAKEAGAAVCWGAGVEDDAAPQYWPWMQVLRDVGDGGWAGVAPADAELLTVLADDTVAASQWSAIGEGRAPGDQRFRMFNAVSSALREASRRRPLVVVLDDLQWADNPSVSLLEFVASQLHESAILLLGCYRLSESVGEDGSGDALTRLTRLGTTTVLTGLDEPDAVRLLERTAGTSVSNDLARLIHEHAAGNPFFLQEIVRLLVAQGRLADAYGSADTLPVLPPTVREVIDRRLARLSSGCAQTLAEASVIGTGFDQDVLVSTTRVSPNRVADLLDEAVRAGVVRPLPGVAFRFRFAHPLIREVLYAELGSSRRAVLHRQVGQAIEQQVVDPLTQLSALAHHFYRAATVGAADKALAYAEQAGRHALAMLAYEEAARHFRHALQMVELLRRDESHRVELLLALGDALLRAGDWPGSVEAYEEVAASARRRGQPHELARAALGLGAGRGGVEVRLFDQRQIDLLGEALDALGEEDTSLRSWTLGRLSVASSFVEPVTRRRAWSREASDIARRLDDERALAHALAGYCDAISALDHVEERLEASTEIVTIARRHRDTDMELLGRRLRVVALLELGDVPAVDREIDAFDRVAGAVRQPLYGWYVPLWKGMRAVMEGRLDDCERSLAQARAIGERGHSHNAQILTFALDLWRLLESGQSEQACSQHERFVDERESGYNQPLFRIGFLARAGHHVEAQALLSSVAADDFAQVAVDDAAAIAGLCFAADAAVDLGDRVAATTLYERLLPHARRFAVSGIGAACLGSVATFLGSLAHVLQRWDAAEEHFRYAADVHRRTGAALLFAHTQRRHAAMLIDHPEPDRARAETMLSEATSTYQGLGLTHWTTVSTGLVEEEQPVPAAETRKLNVFQKEGDLWVLDFAGAQARVKHAKGMYDLARLLASPGKEIHVLDLGRQPRPGQTRVEHGDGLHEQGHLGPLIDDEARRQYKAHLDDLAAEIDDADEQGDSERAKRARIEREALVAHLAAAYGLGGRSRHAGDLTERARSAVTWRIRSAIRTIDRGHPALGHHLAHNVKTGTFCCYAPEQPIKWTL